MKTGTHNLEKLPIAVKLSMYIALIGGILTPILETIRRWHQIPDLHYFPYWFDDYIIGGFLIFAASKTFKSARNGIRFLIAAWGFATGMAYASFFGQLGAINQPDPAPVSPSAVVIIKGIMFLICIGNLILILGHRNYDHDNKN